MKKYTLGTIGILSAILALAICSSPAFGQGEKVTARTALASGSLAPATDILPIVDISAGAAGSKKIVVNDLFTGWGFTTAGSDMAKAANVAAQRTLLGMGTAALLDHGTGVGNLVRLDVTTGKLPAVDGSLLTNLPSGSVEGSAILSTGETGGSKFLREDGDGTSSWQAIPGGGDALVANPLSQFAATTSAQLYGVLSDETGTGVAVFGTSPTIGTPTITSPTINLTSDATGDIYYRGAGGGLTRLGVGTNGHVLTLSAGLPSWAAASGGTTLTDSASLSTALSDETGTGLAVFATSPTLTTPVINLGSDATGDIYYRNSGGALTRLAAGTNGHVLTLAAGLPSWAAASGGGLTNWTDGISTSSPNATVPVSSLTATNAATNVDIALVPKGAGAITAHVADSTATGGNKRGANAIDLQTSRTAAAQVASGNKSTIVGGKDNTASGLHSSVFGGYGNTASAGTSTIIGGYSNTASGPTSLILGGASNTASGENSIAKGSGASTRGLMGAEARGVGYSDGDAQSATYILSKSVTSATSAEAGLMSQTPGAGYRIALPNNSSYSFKVHAVARKSDGTTKAWTQEGAIKRGASAGTTALVGTITEATKEDAGASSWDLNCTADTTNGSLKVSVVGASSGETRFMIQVDTEELVF